MAKLSHFSWLTVAALAVALPPLAVRPAEACPLCGPPQPTLAQDIRAADVAVVVRLVALPPESGSDDRQLNVVPRMAKFAVVEVLHGSAALGAVKQFEAPFFDVQPLGGEYLVYGTVSPRIEWGSPFALTARSRQYLADIVQLPPAGADRLAFCQDYLEDAEDLLRNDAFSEFAWAPYADVQQLQSRMHRAVLSQRIHDPQIALNHRRLYLTMLSVCGGPADLPMLEDLIRNDDPKFRASLDAAAACYLTLKGTDGLELIDDLFLKPKQVEYFDINNIVIALRFLGQQDHGPIPRARLIESMRLVLDQPGMADQALMDLWRWQDWTVLDRAAELFQTADPETASIVRIPAINYLRACPLPQAKTLIEELRKIDPKAVQTSEVQYAQLPPASSAGPQNPIVVPLALLGAALGGAMLLAVAVRGRGKKPAVTRCQE